MICAFSACEGKNLFEINLFRLSYNTNLLFMSAHGNKYDGKIFKYIFMDVALETDQGKG
jgi:hypothetical protein